MDFFQTKHCMRRCKSFGTNFTNWRKLLELNSTLLFMSKINKKLFRNELSKNSGPSSKKWLTLARIGNTSHLGRSFEAKPKPQTQVLMRAKVKWWSCCFSLLSIFKFLNKSMNPYDSSVPHPCDRWCQILDRNLPLNCLLSKMELLF